MILWNRNYWLTSSDFDEGIENNKQYNQVGEEEDYSAFVFVGASTKKVHKALLPVSPLVVLRDSETHDYTNDQTTKVPKIVNVSLCYTDLNVEQ